MYIANSSALAANGNERGIGLIEILIAVVVISIGFLATARMQVDSMRLSQSAYFQTQAAFLASEMVDRMRSNLPGVKSGHYTNQKTSSQASNPQCAVNDCQPQGIAEQDLFDWSSYFHSLQGNSSFSPALPGTETQAASGQILDTGNGIYAIIIRWTEIIAGANQEQSFRVQFALEEPL